MERLYKVLNEDGTDPLNAGIRWNLPGDRLPGEWMPPGFYSLLRAEDLVERLGPLIFEAEARDRVNQDVGAVLFAQARLLRRLDRWNKRTARLFACDCAQAVLPMVWRRGQCKWAIATARKHAYGKATDAKLANANFVIRRKAGRPERAPGIVALLAGLAVLGCARGPWAAIGWAMLCVAAWRLGAWKWVAVKCKRRPEWEYARDSATRAAAAAAEPDPWEAARGAVNAAAHAFAYSAAASLPGTDGSAETFLAGWNAATSQQAKRLTDYLR